MNNYLPIDWDAILEDVAANPEKYKHPEQDVENEAIGIGTDGKPVNLDLWIYEESYGGDGYHLGIFMGTLTGKPGYDFNKLEKGAIKGTVPAYIMEKDRELIPVVDMYETFVGCTELTVAPVIPDTVTHLTFAFRYCTRLTTGPKSIPSTVTDIYGLFDGCSKLTGTIEINANPTDYGLCFRNAATAEGTSLVVTGSSTILDEIIATKSETSNITKGTT